MSQENVEIVQSAFDAWDRGDTDAILDVCDEDIVVMQAVELPGIPALQNGHAGVLEAFALWPGYWDDFHIEVLRTVDLGDQVLVNTNQRGRSQDTGIEVSALFTFLFTLADRKITEWRIFLRESDALEAVKASA
jgi:ketosteroid isomerase-like protein